MESTVREGRNADPGDEMSLGFAGEVDGCTNIELNGWRTYVSLGNGKAVGHLRAAAGEALAPELPAEGGKTRETSGRSQAAVTDKSATTPSVTEASALMEKVGPTETILSRTRMLS